MLALLLLPALSVAPRQLTRKVPVPRGLPPLTLTVAWVATPESASLVVQLGVGGLSAG